jgi:hypothetical protein
MESALHFPPQQQQNFNENELTMVRVWYEPPPYGPMTDLNRSGYGVHGGGLFGKSLERLSKMNQPMVMTGAVVLISIICWIPLST